MHQKRASDLFTDGCEPPCGCWDLNFRPLEEQSGALTHWAISPAPVVVVYFKNGRVCPSHWDSCSGVSGGDSAPRHAGSFTALQESMVLYGFHFEGPSAAGSCPRGMLGAVVNLWCLSLSKSLMRLLLELLIYWFGFFLVCFFFPDLESLGFIPTRPLGSGASASGGSMSVQRGNFLFLFFFISLFFLFFKTGFLFIVLAMVFS